MLRKKYWGEKTNLHACETMLGGCTNSVLKRRNDFGSKYIYLTINNMAQTIGSVPNSSIG